MIPFWLPFIPLILGLIFSIVTYKALDSADPKNRTGSRIMGNLFVAMFTGIIAMGVGVAIVGDSTSGLIGALNAADNSTNPNIVSRLRP